MKTPNHLLVIYLTLFMLGPALSCIRRNNPEGTNQLPTPSFSLKKPFFTDAEFTFWVKEDDVRHSLQFVAGSRDNGGIYAYDLTGNLIDSASIGSNLISPTIGYGLAFQNDTEADLLGYIDQDANKVRIMRLPDLVPVDGGALVLETPSNAILQTMVLYTRDHDDAVFVLVNYKNGSSNDHWTQYQLSTDDRGQIIATLSRTFGTHEGAVDIKSAIVDLSQEYFYYIDPGVGVRKYFADPNLGDDELAVLHASNNDFKALSAYTLQSHGGYIAASTSEKIYLFTRGEIKTPHIQPLVHTLELPTDRFLMTSNALNDDSFAKGLMITRYQDKMYWYDWRAIAKDELILAPNGIPDYSANAIKPKFVTEPTISDTDDPAIWIHPDDPAKSLIIGTDKEDGGGIYVYDLLGKIQRDKVVTGLHRPNNVDLEYGLVLAGKSTDFIIATERNNADVRIYSFPDMMPIDGGGVAMFEGEEDRDPMGVSLYKRSSDDAIFAIVGRKSGPLDNYLWQYRIEDDGTGSVKLTKVRSFGKYSGQKEIEAIAVDDELGYVYYSDEGVGVRKYYADPEKGDEELAFFGQWDFGQDHEGISIFELDDQNGYILISDQQRNRFNVYSREGTATDPHQHQLIKSIEVSTMESDGSEVTSLALGEHFPYGLFVAMSTDRTFHLYDWRDIAGNDLKNRLP